jgi:putative CocE/NonD family hydrolase
MKTITKFPREIVMLEDVGIVMPDGCRLSARIWMPKDAEADPVPAILEHLPYRKRDGTTARDSLTHPWMAGQGYACIRVDMRGNGDSQGLMEDEYTPQELQDACDVIAWAAAQPWCNGRAGMMGISWGGFNSLQVAAMRPPALKAVITLCSTVDRYADDIHYKGGCLLNENFGWAANMLAYSSRPPDPAIVGEAWREMWLERLERQPFLISTWLRHQARDDYWKHGSVCEDYGAIQAAVLSIGGWHDGYRNTISHLVSSIDAPVKGIVGPWIHKYPHYARPQPAIGFLQEAKRWWDRWLKDIDTGVEDDPAMRLWLMDSVRPAAWLEERPGRWIAPREWPPEQAHALTLHLGENRLEQDARAICVEVRSPQDCGAATGEYFPFAFGPELPLDQRGDDALSACFDGPPLAEETWIVGAPRIRLRLSSDRPQGFVCVRLNDLRPDGTSALVTMGLFNLAHRNGHDAPQPLVAGEEVGISFDLDQIAYRLPAGHRLRVAISNAYWPFVWPSPQAGALTLKTGAIEIPVLPPGSAPGWKFEEPQGAKPWNTSELRKARSTKRRETDMATGASTIVVENDFGEVEDLDHGLRSGSSTVERWSIHPDDPLCAGASISWTMTMDRGNWDVRTQIDARMTSDAHEFVLQAKVAAFENGQPLFEKEYADRIARNCI